MVRAGKHGEREEFALENDVVVVGWNKLPDLSGADSKEKLAELMALAYPDEGKYALANYVAQMWSFRGRIKEGDIVVMPLKKVSMIAVGKVAGPYAYWPDNPKDARHTRPIEWVSKGIERSRFGQDLLYSMGAFLTVCKIERHDAEQRIRAVAEGGKDVKAALYETSRKSPEGGEYDLHKPDDTPMVRDIRRYTERGTTFRKVDYTLAGLLHFIDDGVIGLPDIQRPFVWSTTKVRDLFDSMFRGFPVGYLLFWDNDSESGTKQIGVGDKAHRVPSRLIVDGQQRLTSLYAVFRGRAVLDSDYRQRKIEIAFRPRDGKFEVTDAAISRDPEWVANISDVCAAGSVFHVIKSFLERLAARREVSPEEEGAISSNMDRLFDLQKYPFTALEIASSVDEEQVSDIFVRINSEGVTLNQADFILTLLSVFWEEGRKALEQFSRLSRVPPGGHGAASPYNHFIEPGPDQLLRVAVALGFGRGRLKSVYQVLRGKDMDTNQYSPARRDEQFARLGEAQARVLNLTNWHQFFGTLVGAGFRSGGMVSSKTALLYAYVFYLIGRTKYSVPEHELGKLIGKWFFMTALTGRYSTSPESVMDADLNRVNSLASADEYVVLLNRIIDDTLTTDFWNIALPNGLETSSNRSPELFAYYAALNRLDAPVLFSNKRVYDLLDPSVRSNRAALERHHLFPRSWLARQGIQDLKQVNQIANYTLVEWTDNGIIGDEPPTEYVPKMRSRFDDRTWARMMDLHALPDGWHQMEYLDFLSARRKLMAQVVKRAFEELR